MSNHPRRRPNGPQWQRDRIKASAKGRRIVRRHAAARARSTGQAEGRSARRLRRVRRV